MAKNSTISATIMARPGTIRIFFYAALVWLTGSFQYCWYQNIFVLPNHGGGEGSTLPWSLSSPSSPSSIPSSRSSARQQYQYGSPCQLDDVVLQELRQQGLLNPNVMNEAKNSAAFPTSDLVLRNYYGNNKTNPWTGNHTCFLVNQLLATEALAGHHPHCNKHAQNRNLMYALFKFAGTMRPANQAVKEFGRLLQKYSYAQDYNKSYQLSGQQQQLSLQQVEAKKKQVVSDLSGPGVSTSLRNVDSAWISNLFDSLSSQTFINRQSGRIITGYSPDEAIARGWNGSFWAKDLDAPMDIPEIQSIAYDPFILDVLQDLMGVPPILRAVDISFNVPSATGTADPADYSFTTWHKDFNSIRTVKVFVYLSDAVQDEQGPHTYFPYTHEAMPPFSPESAQSLSAQHIPQDYLERGIFTENPKKVFGPAGTLWMEDTHVFHKADVSTKGWRGLLQLDYTVSGYCGKDHSSLYQVLNSIPAGDRSAEMHQDYPRFFQRALVGEYATPKVAPASADLLRHALPLEEAFGPLQYDPLLPDPVTHADYVNAGFAKKGLVSGGNGTNAAAPERYPCWEEACTECLSDRNRGTCEICSQQEVCTCSCAALDPERQRAGSVQAETYKVSVDAAPEGLLIPRIIHQVWLSKDPLKRKKYPKTLSYQESWKNETANGWTYHLYDLKASRRFLDRNFPPAILETFDELRPGAFKSDFVRYCLLFRYGGVYSDNDIVLTEELDRVVQPETTGFASSVDFNFTSDRSWCLLNGLIAASPGHPILALSIARIVGMVLNYAAFEDIARELSPSTSVWRFMKTPYLYLTGPCMLGTSANMVLGRDPFHPLGSGDIAYENPRLPVAGRIRFFESVRIESSSIDRVDPDTGMVVAQTRGRRSEQPRGLGPTYAKATRRGGPWHVTWGDGLSHYESLGSSRMRPLQNVTKTFSIDVNMNGDGGGAHQHVQKPYSTADAVSVPSTALLQAS